MQFQNGNCVLVGGKSDNKQSEYFLDTINEKLFSAEKSSLFPYNKYKIVSDNKGLVKIYEIQSNKEVIKIDFKKFGINDFSDFKVVEDWSNTGKYVLLTPEQIPVCVLVDLDKKSEVKIPWGAVIMEWSNDDKLAIVYHSSSHIPNSVETSLWNLESGAIDNIPRISQENLLCTDDNKYIYTIDTTNIEGTIGYKVERYSIEKGTWEELYKTTKLIDLYSIKFISENEFIYSGLGTNDTKDPQTALLRPEVAFAVKVDLKNKEETIKRLDAFLPKIYMWSSNNKYIYYQDYHGFYKAEVDFDK